MSTKEKNSQPPRKRYTRAFKLEAVELVERGDQPVAAIARSLGVKREVLYSWRDALRKHGADSAFRGQGKPAPRVIKIRRLPLCAWSSSG